jgi:hypothetical protein
MEDGYYSWWTAPVDGAGAGMGPGTLTLTLCTWSQDCKMSVADRASEARFIATQARVAARARPLPPGSMRPRCKMELGPFTTHPTLGKWEPAWRVICQQRQKTHGFGG